MLQQRPATPGDRAFQRAVYAGTRQDELALMGWDPASCERFIDMQFSAQEAGYRQQWPDAQCSLLLVDGQPVGRLWVHRGAQALRVLDISLLPAWRGQGLGGACLQGLLDEAAEHHLPVHLHVALDNPARRLYERLGFRPTGQQGMHQTMEWMETCHEQA